MIVELRLVNYQGDLITLSKDHEDFPAVLVSLGAFGVVYQFTLQIEPTFNVAQMVYRDLPLIELKNHFKEIMAAGYSVSLFTKWDKIVDEAWVRKQQVDKEKDISFEEELFGAKTAKEQLLYYGRNRNNIVTEQLGLIGFWYERLPLFKIGVELATKNELQSEYFIPIEHASEAISQIEKIQHIISPYLVTSEIRTVSEDNIWMSPCYNKTVVAIHSTWIYDYENVIKAINLMEEQLASFKPVPHWGKLFTLGSEVIKLGYPKYVHWKQLVEKYDPFGKFRNEFLNSLFWNEQ